MKNFRTALDRTRRIGSTLLALGCLAITLSPAAAATRLWPNTSLRLTIVQWMPTKGVYEKWDALSGEFVIDPDGSLTLPVIGRLEVGDMDEAALADNIAANLKTRIGLVSAPEA